MHKLWRRLRRAWALAQEPEPTELCACCERSFREVPILCSNETYVCVDCIDDLHEASLRYSQMLEYKRATIH